MALFDKIKSKGKGCDDKIQRKSDRSATQRVTLTDAKTAAHFSAC